MTQTKILSLLVAALVLTGCTTVAPSRKMGIDGLPRGGSALSAETASAIVSRSAKDPAAPAVAQRTTLWPFPLVAKKYRVEHDEERGVISVSDYSMVGLGGPMSYAAMQFSFSRHEYPETGGEAVGSLRRRYWPWHSWVTTRGEPVREIAVDVKGVPLLFEWGRESGPNWYFEDFSTDFRERQSFRFWTALWYLGPVYFDRVLKTEEADGSTTTEDATYFFPLFLGRAPGALLWMSQGVEITNGDDVRRIDGHGPLLSYAGYYRTRHLAGDRKGDASTSVLGGLLWYYDRDLHSDDKPRRTVGPLWGFGGLSRW